MEGRKRNAQDSSDIREMHTHEMFLEPCLLARGCWGMLPHMYGALGLLLVASSVSKGWIVTSNKRLVESQKIYTLLNLG